MTTKPIVVDVERMIKRLRKVMKGPSAFCYGLHYEHERGALLKELRSVAYNLGEGR